MKNINTILAVGAMTVVCGAAEAGMNFSGTYTFAVGTQTNLSPMAYNGASISNVTPGSIAVTGATWSSSSGNFRATNWALDWPVGSLTGQVDLTKYISFTLTANAGFTIDMTSITFGLGRSSTGVRQWQWRSSVDNFASALSNYTTLNVALTNNAGVLQNPDANTGWTGNTLTVSGAEFSGISSVEFRLYGYNAEAPAGTSGLHGPLTFAGTVNAVPAPGAAAMIGLAGFITTRRRK